MNSVNTDMVVRVAIVEDELPNARLLQGLLWQLRPDWKITGMPESVEESILLLKTNPFPDLILMDIQLSDGNCFQIFEQIEFPQQTKIIFTTAYDEYAIKAFKVNSIDYLLKPIDEKELEQAFIKFERLRQFHTDPPDLISTLGSILQAQNKYKERFLVSGINSFQKIEARDIAYFYSFEKNTIAQLFTGKSYPLNYSLDQLEKLLDPSIFYRVNRKFIVHIDAIDKAFYEQGNKLRLQVHPDPGMEILISRLKTSEFKHWIGQ